MTKSDISIIGLRKKPTYDELVEYIDEDKDKIRYPNRAAKRLRESPELAFLDGEGLVEIEQQQQNIVKAQQKEQAIRSAGASGSLSGSSVEERARTSSSSSSARSFKSTHDEAQHFDIFTQDDDMGIDQAADDIAAVAETVEERQREKMRDIENQAVRSLESAHQDATVDAAHSIASGSIDPETHHEPKGKRGRPRKYQPPTSSSTSSVAESESSGGTFTMGNIIRGGVELAGTALIGGPEAVAADVTRRAVGMVGRKVAQAITPTPVAIDVEDRARRPRADSGNGDKKPMKMSKSLASVAEEEPAAEGGASSAPKFKTSASSHVDDVKVKASSGYPSKTAGIKSEKIKPSAKASKADEEKEKAEKAPKTTGIKKESGVKKDTGLTKQKPHQPSGMIPPSKIGIQRLREVFEVAKNRKELSTNDVSEYLKLYDEWREAKGNRDVKAQKLAGLRALYKKALYKQ